MFVLEEDEGLFDRAGLGCWSDNGEGLAPYCTFVVGGLTRVERFLFSQGVRDDPQPRRRAHESTFEFLDRIRQPAFERQRSWWEAAFSRYPAGKDRADLCSRFRSNDDAQHWGAAWELAQHEFWVRLGWTLTTHPGTPDGHFRDFLVEHPDHDSFYLECAVDLEGSESRNAEQRWAVVEQALKSVRSPQHQLVISLRNIGGNPLATRRLRQAAQDAVDRLPAGRSGVILDVNEAGWQFSLQATERPWAGSPMVSRGTVRSLDERFFHPIRHRIVDKANKSGELDKPFVVALLVMYPLPILSKADVVKEALFGTSVTTLGPTHLALGKSNRGDGVWFDGHRARRTGVSAVFMQQDLWPGQQLPELHLHPEAKRPFTAPVPIDVWRYEVDDGAVQARCATSSTRPQEFFGLPDDWPGPENRFEGVNNDSPLPAPESWTPQSAEDGYE